MDELARLRSEIDGIDGEMAALFERRMKAASDVAAFKRERGLPVLDASREDAVIEKNLPAVEIPLRPYYDDFLRHLMGLSRQYQRALMGVGTVAYQGGESGFGHRVLAGLFPHAQPLALPTFEAVFEAVETGDAAYGVVPFENSTTGDVSGVLDLCRDHAAYIAAMVDLPVHQNLLALPGAGLGDIKTVISHVQALEQCRPFLKSLGAELVPFANTALAAAEVAGRGDKSCAAIAAEDAAERYGLAVLAPDIESDAGNTTRFIVLSKERPSAGDRFSLLLSADNRVGMLAGVIEAISAAGFDMESIKSRPVRGKSFEYYFYIELVGDANSAQAAKLLEHLDKICSWVRLLGIYHRRDGGEPAPF